MNIPIQYTKSNVELAAALQPLVRYIRAIEAVAVKQSELQKSEVKPDWENATEYPINECISKMRLDGFSAEADQLQRLIAHDRIDIVEWVLATQQKALLSFSAPQQVPVESASQQSSAETTTPDIEAVSTPAPMPTRFKFLEVWPWKEGYVAKKAVKKKLAKHIKAARTAYDILKKCEDPTDSKVVVRSKVMDELSRRDYLS